MSVPSRLYTILLFLMLAACGHKGLYSKGYYSGHSGQRPTAVHVVQAGETLYSIAFQYGQDYREVARWNDIDHSYTIYPEQALKVIKPTSYRNTNQASDETKVNKQAAAEKYPPKPQIPARTPTEKRRNGSHKLRWQWPAKGAILSRFSASDPGQKGIAIAGKKSSRIYAAEAGYVVYSGSGLRGYGKLIIIKHNETFLSAYAHNEQLRAREGEKVKKGEHIADMGNTGTDKVKLHFEIRHNGTPVDPFKYLPKP